jgi:glycosyltransferase involved in cell wall biosynthesis
MREKQDMPRGKINILSFVPTWFDDRVEKGGGGWVRFSKIIGTASETNLNYHLTRFELSLDQHSLLSILKVLRSALRSFLQSLRIIGRKNIHLILSPVEVPHTIILSYLCSIMTGRKYAAFLNTVPFYGLIGLENSWKKNSHISLKGLILSIKWVEKHFQSALIESLGWYITYKILQSSRTKIICLSPVVAEELSQMGLKNQIIGKFPGNGIDFRLIQSSTKPRDQNLKTNDAIYAAGSFNKQKGIFDVISIWEKVVGQYPKAQLAIAGSVYYKSPHVVGEAFSLIEKLGLQKNVHIVGNPYEGISQEALWNELKCSGIFVYPSKKDVWPLVIGEALACGLPVVAYRIPGVEYAYEDCLAVDLQNVGDIEKTANSLIRKMSDIDLITELSSKALEYAESHSWNRVAVLERQSYLDVLGLS